MKAKIHPRYYPEAKVSCSGCGREFTVGSTQPEIRVELCSNCHPFYTGKQKLVDTAGRVERFRDRMAKAKQGKPISQAKPAAKPSGPPAPADRLKEMKRDLEKRQDQAEQ